MQADRRTRDRVVVYRAEEPDGRPHEARYESIADALHFACRDLRSGRRRPVQITEDGRVVYDAARIAEAMEQAQADLEERFDEAADQEDHPAR